MGRTGMTDGGGRVMSALKRSAWAFAATVGVLIACGLVLGLIEGRATAFLMSVFGWGGIVATGLVGTPIHELGHFLTAKLFGFRVTDVALFRPVAGKADGVLGYVSYTYDQGSLWQQLGCFFVGIAPMVLGVLAILLLLRLLTPEAFHAAKLRMDRGIGTFARLRGAFTGFWSGIGKLRGWGIARGVIGLYLVFSISTHMTLSLADLRGAAVGLVVVVAVCLIFGAVTELFKLDVAPVLQKTAVTIAMFFGVGIVFAALALGVFGVLSVLLGR
ncbi:MAG: hypothetical protein EOM52_02875 [Clostridia bacterium]|nr:hypothetical protein [Clostridia bacterium]